MFNVAGAIKGLHDKVIYLFMRETDREYEYEHVYSFPTTMIVMKELNGNEYILLVLITYARTVTNASM